jgi:hypothetical protein
MQLDGRAAQSKKRGPAAGKLRPGPRLGGSAPAIVGALQTSTHNNGAGPSHANSELPLLLSVNALWRSNRGRVHRSERYDSWELVL